jgi:hypothetical protein
VPRRTRTVERLAFDPGAPEPVLAFMLRLSAAGEGWVNFIPRPLEDGRSTRLRALTLFSGDASGVTMGTWVPARLDERTVVNASLGLTHATGRRALAQLRDASLELPAGWIVAQDHPRRGLVITLPVGVAHEVIVTWAVRAVHVLSPGTRIGPWRAEVHLPLDS